MAEPGLRQQLAADASKCVRCGLCVPRCPTWIASGNEANSPRGRIMLMEALARDGRLPAGGARYLDACLECGLCEEVCPSDVPYGRMHRQAAALAPPRPAPLVRLLLALAAFPWRGPLLRLGLALARPLAPLDRLLPRSWRLPLAWARSVRHEKIPPLPARRGPVQGRARLLRGCFAGACDRSALDAAGALLAACGWEIGPPQDGCCGGVHGQAGRLEQAAACQARLRAGARAGEVLLATASACALELGGTAEAPAEAGAFLLAHADRLPAGGRAAEEFDVFVHLPCTQRRLPGRGGWVAELLGRVPGARIRMLPDNETCCGAGGLTAFGEPAAAAALGRRKAAAAARVLGPGAVVATSNYACRCQLGAALRAAGLANKITDPYSLLARSLAA